MFVCESLKEKIIIVAEHDVGAMHEIVTTLKARDFPNVFTVDSSEKVYEILRNYHDEPEKVGLVVISEFLSSVDIDDMRKNLTYSSNSFEIPFVIIGNIDSQHLNSPSAVYNVESDKCLLTYRINNPANSHELVLAVKCLLNLKQERFWRYQQKEQLHNEIAAKSLIDAKLQYLVAHDELTGLFNRSSFESQFKLILKQSQKEQNSVALLFIDVDRFSLINELEGFDAGDRLLVELTLLIRKLIPEDSLFARLGSDEFCLFLNNSPKSHAIILAETIKNSVDEYRFFTGKVFFSAAVSIGIVIQDKNHSVSHPGEMILHARQACHFAKNNGRDRVWVYSCEDNEVKERQRDIYWVPLLRKALRENGFFLVFQPVVKLSDGYISHYEVLLRMWGAGGEIITPEKFIPAAERMGLIHSIDLWVVENAIDFLVSSPLQFSNVSLAINLSSLAFQYPDLLATIRSKLLSTKLDASRLTFEITETAAIDNIENAMTMMSRIHALGCKFALDDFGAGFCSFNYLKTFPVDYVKIDGQFIRNLLEDETDQLLVKSMVEIAEKLGKTTIAEFVESVETALKLKELGVNYAQGYVFGRPERHLLNYRQTVLNNIQPESMLQI
ncbi:EAL domain-containing protein [Methylomonas sp. AM2-LC]|uniref:putative bifunctional diguanylate cyclase/phosphodiesterase n=1 Tax=Methylomonas sp. AM2-LC TaxID=3153301 RepID=UPI003266F060